MDRWESKVDCEILKEAVEKGTPGCAGCSLRQCPIVVDDCDVVAKFKSAMWKKMEQGECILDNSVEQFSELVLNAARSYIVASKVAQTFCERDFSAIFQQYADTINKSVDGLTENEKRQAVMNAVLGDAE